ncbi:MAG: DUF86 domain-containing protein [Leadbetterella sp.]|jgi:uncharacterized protein with HEPN domain|nr:DUF86 domain-containing protein [Leadbetterella sp.]
MQPSLTEFLRHIEDEINFCLNQTKGKDFETFSNDEILTRAIVRSLEIIGEASKKIPPDFRSLFPLIAWKDISGMRDRLIHHYFGVDLEIVWNTVLEDLPILAEWMAPLIAASKQFK